jgi:hypothetical protein
MSGSRATSIVFSAGLSLSALVALLLLKAQPVPAPVAA